MMCDIDRFKAINDEYGHEFGDRVLVQIGEVQRVFANDNGIVGNTARQRRISRLLIPLT
jgi:diguanylate cyclase (GGDEF)-like protein